jgi:hypothetical protein
MGGRRDQRGEGGTGRGSGKKRGRHSGMKPQIVERKVSGMARTGEKVGSRVRCRPTLGAYVIIGFANSVKV